MTDAYLVLEDGTVMKGSSCGEEGLAVGEVVFNTSTSYQDIISDPTYCGQLVVQTYPLIGNRGVDPASRLFASGYIVREWCLEPTDIHEFLTLDSYLKQSHVVGLCGIDTRRLTRMIRDKGVMNGAITTDISNMDALLKTIREYRVCETVGQVTVDQPVTIHAQREIYRVAAADYGFRHSFLNHLTSRGCTVTLYPAKTSAAKILKDNPDGLLLSDGPGDPWDNPDIIAIIKELIESRKPLFGVGLGHQLLGVACGFECEKMAVGHRGSNQPVRCLDTGKIMITNQNHGYGITKISEDIAAITMENVNDNSVEGLSYRAFPAITTQFEPTDGNGYQDTAWIFDAFVSMMEEEKQHA